MNTEKFLEFNGKKLTLVNQDGNFFIALKPIIEVLEVDWSSHHKWLKSHTIFSSVMVNITTTGSDGKAYKMVCIPEKFIYGWLLSFSPKTQTHITFQQQCYDILYNHFHNLISTRTHELQQRTHLKQEHTQLHQQLLANDSYARLLEIQQQIKNVNNSLNNFDNQLLTGQLEISF